MILRALNPNIHPLRSTDAESQWISFNVKNLTSPLVTLKIKIIDSWHGITGFDYSGHTIFSFCRTFCINSSFLRPLNKPFKIMFWTSYADWIYTVISLSGLLLITWLVLNRSQWQQATRTLFNCHSRWCADWNIHLHEHNLSRRLNVFTTLSA